ncbi:two-component system, sensor histidine kinase YesM [Paenibacillus sp. 1_12]|uniref:cache domain-containing sensor histidine kinase n=1 Tax=Paenibacillus sp. 1_12 TaxID=1566278 RepID=UPI0008E74B83|nr:sensor histidine kinase [Paenibacillus sp. 1_12]SFK78318.1 two-component system, sensor histidine kinase YesM [Paenibacillus sp. 1_12]
MARTNLFRLKNSIFAKFTFSFITVGLIPLLVISYISLSTFSGYMERYAVSNFEQMLLFASKNVEDMHTRYNNISKVMYTYAVDGYGELGEAIMVQNRMEDRRLRTTLGDFVRSILYSDPYLNNVLFVLPNGQIQMLNRESRALDTQFPFPPADWSARLSSNPKGLTFIPTHPERYIIGSNRNVTTFGRNLLDVTAPVNAEARVLGTLYMDVNEGAFDEVFKKMLLGAKDEIYVLNDAGICLYSNQPARIGSYYIAKASNDYLHMQQEITNTGWRVVGDFYKEEMFLAVERIIRSIIIVICVCMISLITVAIWFSNRFSGPIRSLTRQMAKMESGNLDIQVTVLSNDEVGLLARGFNKMVIRLKSFIDEVYVAQIKQKQAELNALKSQIRPHYLYNTLEVIRMSAVANDDNEVGDMIHSLSNQLKYVLNSGEENVTVLDEKMNIEEYFRLMVMRYGEHKLEIEFRIDPDYLNCSIPKLSLQPIVENAVYHGIMPKIGKGKIRISVEPAAKDQITIIVDDDGVGITEERLQSIRQKLAGQIDQEQAGSIGMKNVHDRLITLYGDEYGLEMNSKPSIGTSVRMTIPLIRELNSHAESRNGR